MAKPRVFVSSTYYDLRHIRDRLETFIESFGYEAVLFESGDIPFRHDAPLDESCYSEIRNCHILVLIVGNRYGSAASTDNVPNDKREDAYQFYNSITKNEYLAARERDIPIFVFVEKNVLAEFRTYKLNRANKDIRYAHVDSPNVFLLLEDIVAQRTNNFVRDFERFDDISEWLRDQWAGLFADQLSRRQSEAHIKGLSAQVAELAQVTNVLQKYNESIIRKLQPKESSRIISRERKTIVTERGQRLLREPMLQYVAEHSNVRLKPTETYNALKSSADLDHFLSALKLPDAFLKKFLGQYRSEAQQDYDKFKTRYIGGVILTD
jgi:hypothetical protein